MNNLHRKSDKRDTSTKDERKEVFIGCSKTERRSG